MMANSSVAFTGSGDNFTFHGASTLSVGGNNDGFIFEPTPGSATIAGYNSTDQIYFDHSTFSSWQSLLSQSSQVGNDTLIHTDATHSVTLQNVTLASLKQNNFHFT